MIFGQLTKYVAPFSNSISVELSTMATISIFNREIQYLRLTVNEILKPLTH